MSADRGRALFNEHELAVLHAALSDAGRYMVQEAERYVSEGRDEAARVCRWQLDKYMEARDGIAAKLDALCPSCRGRVEAARTVETIAGAVCEPCAVDRYGVELGEDDAR